jgi:hypothetical protein
MWPTLRTLWLSLFGKAPPRGSIHRRPHARRPFLEVLEDRTVPASLGYSTLLQGTVYATAVDSAGDVYVTGTSSNLPTTPGAFATTGSGAFVAKLNPTGTAVLYATYLGNGNTVSDAGTGIAVDAAGDAYVIGEGGTVPTTANAIAASGGDDFVAELNPTGSALNYATYLPGTIDGVTGFSYAGAIAVDGSGNIDVAGAAGAGLPVTAGAFQTACLAGTGGSDPFFMKINPALSGRRPSSMPATSAAPRASMPRQASPWTAPATPTWKVIPIRAISRRPAGRSRRPWGVWLLSSRSSIPRSREQHR